MNSVQKRQVVRLQAEYIKNTGMGQFTCFGFADWLMEEAPDLATKLVEEKLRQMDKIVGGAPRVTVSYLQAVVKRETTLIY